MWATEAPVVVKIGGSFASSPHLQDWLRALAGCAGRAVIAPGGGPFADAVRSTQLRMGFDDRTAHHMALLAMEQYGRALAGCNATLMPADSLAAIQHALRLGRLPVWMPVRMVLDAEDIAPSWEVTSDSLAAWLAGRLGGGRLFLVKHAPALAGPTKAEKLAALGIVDRALPLYLRKSALRTFVLGPCDHDAVGGAVRTGTAAGVAVE
jgi:5-(aminomethyl)-3-furanmethanol phosphate kinase